MSVLSLGSQGPALEGLEFDDSKDRRIDSSKIQEFAETKDRRFEAAENEAIQQRPSQRSK